MNQSVEGLRRVELDFAPPRPLRSPHVQSVLASAAPRRARVVRGAQGLLDATRACVVPCPDGTRLEARIARHPLRSGAEPRPVVIALHGWHGSADSLYLLSSCGRLFDAGFDVVRLHLRDHGGTHALNEGLFHSCRIDEAVAAVAVLREWFPDRPLALLGFSLGGNFALRIALRAPAGGIELNRVLAVCPVLEPGSTMEALDRGWIGYRLYFLRNWRRSMLAKQAAFPHLYDFSETLRLRSLGALTDWFVERHTEFTGTRAYLRGYTLTGDVLAGLEVPSEIVTSLDDPVIPAAGLERLAANPNLEVSVTPHGGHCGFIRDLGLSSWLDEELLRRLAPLRDA